MLIVQNWIGVVSRVAGIFLLAFCLLVQAATADRRAGLGASAITGGEIEAAGTHRDGQTQLIVPVEGDAGTSQSSDHSKLGIHGILADGIPELIQRVADGGTHFSVVKAVDDVSWLSEVKDISPDTITVARLTSPQEGASLVNDPATDLMWYANTIMGVIFDKIEQQPELLDFVDYWEPINEPLGGGVPPDAYARLAQLMINCMDLAEARGLQLALFSFSAGTPEWADMTAVVETGVFGRAKAGGHILALHEGVLGNDPIDQWYGAEHIIPGAPEIADTGSLCARYRYWYDLLEQRDEIIPLFISEFYAGGGYGAEANTDDIVKRMAWYDDQLQRDDYVLGFGPFTLGPVGVWVAQDYDFVYPALLERLMGIAAKEHRLFFFLPAILRGPTSTREPVATPTLEAAPMPTPTKSEAATPSRAPTHTASVAATLQAPPSQQDEAGRGNSLVALCIASAGLALAGGLLIGLMLRRRSRA